MAGRATSPRRWWAAGLWALGACGTQAAPAPDFQVRDTDVVVRSAAPFTRTADFPARVESTLAVALAYWGGSWAHLRGRTIHFEGERFPCGDRAGAVGCFDGDIRISTRDLAFEFSCVEQTSLVHEVGHAVIGDAAHVDARWRDFSGPQEELQGRIGYAGTDEVPCPIFVSVWRHPAPP